MYATREEWLRAAVDRMRPWFRELGHEIPEYYVSIGFPSTGARSNRIGECHYTSEDGKPHLFVHPAVRDGIRVLDILLHELTHSVLDHKHGKPFKRLATALGLTGKMTATTATPELTWTLSRMIERGIGPYPHAALVTGSRRKKQTTRMIKIVCLNCTDDKGDPVTSRMTRKWLDLTGGLICPLCEERMVETA